MNSKSEAAVSRINEVVATLDNETAKLGALTDAAVEKTSAVASDIEEKRNYLRTLADEVTVSLQKLNQQLGENADGVNIQTKVSIEQLDKVAEIMAKHRDNLVEASNIVVTQSKISETSLAQQQRHISGSVNKIEETKAELKRQIEELTRAAAIIDSEAGSAIGRLKTQMDQALKAPKKLSSEPKTSEQICRNSWKSLMIPLPTRWPKSASLKISFPNSTTSWKAFPVALPTALQPLPMS